MRKVFATHNWIIELMTGYMEYTTVGERSIYRRTVSYDAIVWC
jgi:hypothetical protein